MAVFDRRDLMAFFQGSVKENPEAAWDAHEAFPDELPPSWSMMAAGTPVYTWLNAHMASYPAHPVHTRQLNQSATAATLLAVVSAYAARAQLYPLERRLSQCEERLDRLETRAGPSTLHLERASSVLSAATRHITDVVAAFKEAFGQITPQVSILPVLDDPGMAQVVINASEADPSVLSDARAAGARVHFFDLLVERIPSHVLDTLDFDFVFRK